MARKELKLLYHMGHIVTSYGACCYIIRGTLLHHTGHVVTSYGAHCYNKEHVNHNVTRPRVTVIALTGLYTFIHLTHSVHNNIAVHSFIY